MTCGVAVPGLAHAQATPPAPPPAAAPAPAAAATVTTTVGASPVPPPAAPATLPAPPAPTPPPGAAPEAPAPPKEEKYSEPFAFGDFTWLNGNNRQTKAVLDTPIFTPSIMLDVAYTASANNPIDDTVVGSTALSRNNELTLAFLGFGGDLHVENVRMRWMMQFGQRATIVPRNDGSSFRGQYDLQTALRYISEANGGYHWNAWHGINLDTGIFMSYVGLFSYDNYENWMYLPSFTSDNTPWFFNGVRLQTFPTDTFKSEWWLINGWQSYGKFNEMPGFGCQQIWRPKEWFSILTNDYVGWDTQDNPGRFRFHTDNSLQIRWYNDPSSKIFNKVAFSLTGDVGGETGDGVTPFGGHSTNNTIRSAAGCTSANPCTQHFLSFMTYHRAWFMENHLAFTAGVGAMSNPGRYLVLGPTGNASPFAAPTSTTGVALTAVSHPFSLNPGTTFNAFDYEAGFQYMPNEQITYNVEFNHRQSDVPYFAGHGGVTSPDGYSTTAVPAGWRPDLVKSDDRIIVALLVRF
jgi:opacity protein-like surface antigen